MISFLVSICLLLLISSTIVDSFRPPSSPRKLFNPHLRSHETNEANRNFIETLPEIEQTFRIETRLNECESENDNQSIFGAMLFLAPLLLFVLNIQPVMAAMPKMDIFDPSQFQPVCPTSDGFYQLSKSFANFLVGQENVVQYGPLIASVLLRVRLELCVLESFLYEAVVPFVKQNGLSWVLPLHETVESFLAGTIFALASNFILLGSTKIVSVLFIYFDVFTGMPSRFIGGNGKKIFDKAPQGLIFSGIKLYGDACNTIRDILVSVDSFVGKYLVVASTLYIAFKFAHFKLFNDIFP